METVHNSDEAPVSAENAPPDVVVPESEAVAPTPFKPYATRWIIAICVATTILIDAFEVKLPDEPWGVGAIAGQWWRLPASGFLHIYYLHLFSNMLFLWVLGRRLERILGTWIFLLFYFSCGLTATVAALLVRRAELGIGASGAIFGVAGGVLIFYWKRIESLTRRQQLKLGLLMLYVVWVLYDNVTSKYVYPKPDMLAHIAGLGAGLLLALILSSSRQVEARAPKRVFATVAALLVVGCIVIRVRDPYVVHLDAAFHAMDRGQFNDAAKQVIQARQLRPSDQFVEATARELSRRREEAAKTRTDYCGPLLAGSPQDPCEGQICDGSIHARTAADGSTTGYVGTTQSRVSNGVFESESSLTIVTVDDVGLIGCAVSRTSARKARVNADGTIPSRMGGTTSKGTIGHSDPQAESLRQLILAEREKTHGQ